MTLSIRHQRIMIAMAAIMGGIAVAARADQGTGQPPGGLKSIAESLGFFVLLALWLLAKAGRWGLAVWAEAAAPRTVADVRATYQRFPVRSVWAGLLTALILFVALAVVGQLGKAGNKPLALLGFLGFLGLAGMAIRRGVLGVAAIYHRLGERMAEAAAPGENRDAAAPPAGNAPCRNARHVALTIRGGAVLEAASLVPLIGHVIGAWLMLAGLGASVITYYLQRGAAPPEHRVD